MSINYLRWTFRKLRPRALRSFFISFSLLLLLLFVYLFVCLFYIFPHLALHPYTNTMAVWKECESNRNKARTKKFWFCLFGISVSLFFFLLLLKTNELNDRLYEGRETRKKQQKQKQNQHRFRVFQFGWSFLSLSRAFYFVKENCFLLPSSLPKSI